MKFEQEGAFEQPSTRHRERRLLGVLEYGPSLHSTERSGVYKKEPFVSVPEQKITLTAYRGTGGGKWRFPEGDPRGSKSPGGNTPNGWRGNLFSGVGFSWLGVATQGLSVMFGHFISGLGLGRTLRGINSSPLASNYKGSFNILCGAFILVCGIRMLVSPADLLLFGIGFLGGIFLPNIKIGTIVL